MEVLTQLKEIVAQKQLKIEITDDILDKDFKTLGLDSLDTFSIIVDLENYFKVSLSDELMMSLKSINDLIKAFENLIKNK
ncbi:phosphopantetheine-binding protein [Mycoplasmoides pirum]|uniref:phosphopantetheine-binding protein n=1 Tax=Mycoplasmoides pirum TaxID=2122 RepID=UPI000487F1F5|nr:phosphopantetheine-binding protein [Mycoplasmoides pirum]